ncbi:L-threonylcarbamoyladenylate synthase [Frigidibacter sp. ROC022]|uniref:L-threonylcarbamoyladenylate synthase n=1 Tax=Frigidibacter sp. ROC022 TaxID=2971796 RepID=UPI00215B3548|nr:L-threonylcarbamoyladenylate synthase [Frigidibacter sp. ROC022]MCR8724928.1 L-threonylcarbamoyladenylate synthase [Frigidibacter sp. ROC022]
MTERLATDPEGIARAAALLRQGALVGFPTETVYGLGADATDDRAVARIYQAKGRPQFNPLIVHLPDIDSAGAVARLEGDALRLAGAFWPGPLTLVLPVRDAGLSPLLRAGLPTVALRVPDLPLARDLLRRVARPVAAPSANPSGRISPTRAEHVLDGLAGRIEAVLDGGPCVVGVESTIVGFGPEGPQLLRPGGLPAEALEGALGRPLAAAPQGAKPNAPGQLSSHYAPAAPVRLDVTAPGPGEVMLGFGPVPGDLSLSESGDLVEAAANLFHMLRALDVRGAAGIAVAPIPDHGLGRAIRDRLARAAAPR